MGLVWGGGQKLCAEDRRGAHEKMKCEILPAGRFTPGAGRVIIGLPEAGGAPRTEHRERNGKQMKKFVSLALCLAMIMAWIPGGAAGAANGAPFAGGSGTEDDPYLVSTADQLEEVRNYSSSYFLQTNDIDLSDVSYMPSQSIASGGVYDGGGNCIVGYEGSSALFSSNSGTIQNLGMKDGSITFIQNTSGQHLSYTVGGMVGRNNGTIHSCYAENMDLSVSVSMKATHSFATVRLCAGGIAGVNSGTISCSYISGTVSGSASCQKYNIAGAEASATAYVGGIAGENNSGASMINCYSTASVTGNKYKGTLCGYSIEGGVIEKCYYSKGPAAGLNYGAAVGTYKTADEIKSAAFANELNANSSDYNWEMGRDSSGNSAVVQTMQNLTVSANYPSGTYDMPITVEITSDRAPGLDLLYYSVVGVTGGKQPYDGPITLEQDAVILVYAVHSGNPDAYRVSMFQYKSAEYPVEASPQAGTYAEAPQTITLTTQMPGAEIYYTLDGSDPTSGGTEYGGPFFIFKNTTVTAAAKVGEDWGDPLSFIYKISPEITATKPEGDYTEPFTVELESSVPQYAIYYTVDGFSDPTANGIKYIPGQGIEIYKTTTLQVACTFEGEWSDVTTFQYDFPTPVITPSVEEGEYEDVVHLTLECDTPYVTLSYLAPGVIQPETVYEPGDVIDIYKTATLTVYAKYKGQHVSWDSWNYTLPDPTITADPGAGAYNQIQTIALSSNIPSYQLYYTLDNSDPATEGTLYSGPFELDYSATLKVCAKYGEHVVKTDSFSYNLSALPSVTATPAAGDIKAPIDIELAAPNAFYTVYYTTDGSNPKTSSTRIKYDSPIHIEDPKPITIKAVPELNGTYGTTSEFRYTFNSQKLAMEKAEIEKHADYEITFTVTNTLPEDKTVTFYAAAYLNGQMLNAAGEQAELPEGTRGKEIMIRYPYSSAEQLPQDAVIKVFCLDSVTRQPYCDSLTYKVSEADVFQELDSISVSPNPIVGQVGERIERPKVTAHYTNGRPDQVVSMNLTFTPDYEVVLVGYPSLDLSIKSEGEGVLTVSYSEGGITKSTKVPVIGKAANVNLGFLADPTADSLPEDAIPISTAEDLAAIKGADSVGKTYYLTRDIQLTGEWEPIYGFQGTLDGRGYTVSGLYISSASKEQLAALFASAYDAVIKNLAVEIDPRGVAAYNDDAEGDYAYAAGLVGDSRDTDYINCYVTGGPVSATGAAPYAGGLVGYLMNQKENRVVNCFSTCSVSAESTQSTASNICMAGGLIGELESGNGYQTTTLSRCYATGNVSINYPGGSTGAGGTQAGGLLGSGSRLEISDCFALGEVNARRGVTTTTSSAFVGGLGGWLIDTSLERCYAAGNVSGGSKSHVGGLAAASVSDSYCYRVNQSVQGTSYHNDGESIADSWEQSSYEGFDFTSTWTFTEGAFRGLPHLQYQE